MTRWYEDKNVEVVEVFKTMGIADTIGHDSEIIDISGYSEIELRLINSLDSDIKVKFREMPARPYWGFYDKTLNAFIQNHTFKSDQYNNVVISSQHPHIKEIKGDTLCVNISADTLPTKGSITIKLIGVKK